MPGVGDAVVGLGRTRESRGQVVGPAPVGVEGGGDAVGDRVAERDHGAGAADHVDAADVVPDLGAFAECGGRGVGGVVGGAAAEHRVLHRRRVVGDGAGGLGRPDADQQVAVGRHAQGDRVADGVGAGRDGELPAAVEQHVAHGAGHRRAVASVDGAVALPAVVRGDGDRDVAEQHRFGAVAVGQVDADLVAARGGVDDVPDGESDVALLDPADRGGGRGGPGGGPGGGGGSGRRGGQNEDGEGRGCG